MHGLYTDNRLSAQFNGERVRLLKQSATANVMVFMSASSDHVTGLAGLTLTITASKNGGAFASISPVVTDRGSGWYSLALTVAHTDTLGDFVLHVTATNADASDMLDRVVAVDYTDAYAFGLSRIDAAVTTRAVAGDAMTLTAGYDPAKSAAKAGDAMALTTGERSNVVAALLDLADAIETGFTLRQALRVIAAAVGGKVSGSGTGTEVFRDIADLKNRITATVDSSGNRTAITVDAA